MPKETSEEVAELASRYLGFNTEELENGLVKAFVSSEWNAFKSWKDGLCCDIRTLAASCLSQRSDADD